MPDSKIYLMNNILPADYTHVVDFLTNTAQSAFWISKAQSDMTSAGISSMGDLTYTWTPRGNTIQIGTNINNLFTINYCMIQNTYNNKSKWLYYFITNKTYVNDNVTECTLQLDLFQTYMFAYDLGQSYVLREHCNIEDDTYNNNFVPEDIPIQPILYHESALDAYNQTFQQYAVMAVVGYMDSQQQGQNFGKIKTDYSIFTEYPYQLSVFQNVLTPLNYYYFNLNTEQGRDSLELVIFKNQENIQNIVSLHNVQSCCFNIPNVYPGFQNADCGPLNFTDDSIPNTNYKPKQTNITLNYTPTSVRGLTDLKNKKLFHAPYNNLVVLNSRFEQIEFDFGRFDGNPSFIIMGNVLSGGKATLIPNNYFELGIATSFIPYTRSLDVTKSAQIPIERNDFLAYKQADEGFAITKLGIQSVSSAISSLLGFSGSVEAASTGGKVATHAREIIGKGQLISSFSSIGVSALDLAHKTDTLKDRGSSITNNASTNIDAISFNVPDIMFATSTPPVDELRRLDTYFEMFGYAVKNVKVPETRNRPCWNYIQIQNVSLKNLTGTTLSEFASANDVDAIKQIYENGVTIWHNYDYVYNYMLDNHSTTALQERLNNV